jgi:uncharacterized membrane protein
LTDRVTDVVVLLAIVLNALQAGTYYTWASGVMPGLARTDDRTFVDAIQEMNRAIINPVFMLSFLGAPAVSVVAAIVVADDARWWGVAAAALSVATIVITFGGNIPLNNAIDRAGEPDEIADLGAVRRAFEPGWVRLNAIRAVSSTLATAGFGWAALVV